MTEPSMPVERVPGTCWVCGGPAIAFNPSAPQQAWVVKSATICQSCAEKQPHEIKEYRGCAHLRGIRLTVLQFIADHGPVAGRDVMDATGIPSGSVNHCFRDLKSDKLISGVLADAPGPRGGHKAMIWTVSKKGMKRLQAL